MWHVLDSGIPDRFYLYDEDRQGNTMFPPNINENLSGRAAAELLCDAFNIRDYGRCEPDDK